MPRPFPKGRSIRFTGKTYPTLEVEVLYIGDHPTGYSNLKHVIVGLTNEQAVDFYERGYNVKVARKESKFLGVVQTEHLLYLVIDIPKTFSDDKIAELRLEQRYFGFKQATIEAAAQGWEKSDGESGVRLYLESLTFVDKRSRFEVLKDLSEDYYQQYVQRQRESVMPALSRHTFEQQKARGVRPYPRHISQRDYENLNNRQRTVWVVGETIGMFGRDYIIADVTDLDDQWGIRADRKYCESLYIRVPK